MKKGEKPQLSTKWWKKNKAKTLVKTGISDALRKFEVASDKFEHGKALKALIELEKAVRVTISKADPDLHGETIACLELFPTLIKRTRGDIVKQQKRDEKLQREREKAEKQSQERGAKEDASRDKKKPDAKAAVAAPPTQKLGKPVVIWERSLAKEVLKKSAVGQRLNLKFKGYRVSLQLNDDILAVLEAEGDLATPAFMVEDAQDLADKTVDSIIRHLTELEKLQKAGKTEQYNKEAQKVSDAIRSEVGSLSRGLEKIPQARWNKFVGRKKQYKAYKIKSGTKVIWGTVNLAVMAASGVPTGGLSLALGIVGAVQQVAGLTELVVGLCKEAETVQKQLDKDLKSLQKSYLADAAKAKRMGAQEMTKTALATALGAQPPFIASIPKCSDNFTLWENKVAGVEVKGRALSRELMKLMKSVDEFEKAMKSASSKAAFQALDKAKKVRLGISKAFDNAAEMNGRVKSADRAIPGMKAMLRQLDQANPDYSKTFSSIFPKAVGLLSAVANGGLGFAESTKASEFLQTAGTTANDIAGLIHNEVG